MDKELEEEMGYEAMQGRYEREMFTEEEEDGFTGTPPKQTIQQTRGETTK